MRCKKLCKNSKIISVTLVFLLIGIFFASGCLEEIRKDPDYDTAVSNCIDLCEDAVFSQQNLSAGPCLSNDVVGNKRWVCDIARSPRTSIDNQPENQCEAYRNKTATHFVEVSVGCEVIRAV